MVGGVIPTAEDFWFDGPGYQTTVSNVFIVSDTPSTGGIEGLTRSALVLANKLTGNNPPNITKNRWTNRTV